MVIAEKLPAPLGQAVAATARTSFMDGWQVMALITCGMCILGAIFVMRFMPPKHEPKV
jgi:hypothetical protein